VGVGEADRERLGFVGAEQADELAGGDLCLHLIGEEAAAADAFQAGVDGEIDVIGGEDVGHRDAQGLAVFLKCPFRLEAFADDADGAVAG
jgi:hypothetical protein